MHIVANPFQTKLSLNGFVRWIIPCVGLLCKVILTCATLNKLKVLWPVSVKMLVPVEVFTMCSLGETVYIKLTDK